MKTPSAFDKIIIRVLATEQLWVSLAGFPLVLMAMKLRRGQRGCEC
jgi:hypothetical protein